MCPFCSHCAAPKRTAIDEILTAVCSRSRVDPARLVLEGRHATDREKWARMEIYWLARSTTTLSYPQIARATGRKEHSTVIYGARRTQTRINSSYPYRVEMERLRLNLADLIATKELDGYIPPSIEA